MLLKLRATFQQSLTRELSQYRCIYLCMYMYLCITSNSFSFKICHQIKYINIYIYKIYGCYTNLRIYDYILNKSKMFMLAWCQETVLQVRASRAFSCRTKLIVIALYKKQTLSRGLSGGDLSTRLYLHLSDYVYARSLCPEAFCLKPLTFAQC